MVRFPPRQTGLADPLAHASTASAPFRSRGCLPSWGIPSTTQGTSNADIHHVHLTLKDLMKNITRITLSVAAAISLALAATGCVRLEVNATVTNDDKVNGTLIVGLSESLYKLSQQSQPGQAQSSLDSMDLSNFLPTQPGVTSKPFHDSNWVGRELVIKDLPIEKFTPVLGTSAPWRLTRDGDQLNFKGDFDLSSPQAESAASSPYFSAFAATTVLKVVMTFPGKIVNTNATYVDGNKLEWDGVLGQNTPMYAVVDAPKGNPALMIFGIVAGVIVVLAVAILLGMRVRRGKPVHEVESSENDETDVE